MLFSDILTLLNTYSGLFAVLALLTPPIGWVFVQYTNRAKIVVRFNGGLKQSSPGHIVNYVAVPDEPNVFDADLSERKFNCLWRGNLTLTNIGKSKAERIELYFHNESPIVNIKSFINENDIIDPGKELSFDTEYKLSFISTPRKRPQIEDNNTAGVIFQNFKIVIKYKSSWFTRYTVFTFPKKNEYKDVFQHRFRSLNKGKPPEPFFKG